jgi:uncharacterized membrane protein YiaA
VVEMVNIEIKAGHVFALSIGMLFVGLLQLGHIAPEMEFFLMAIAAIAAVITGLYLSAYYFG